MKKILEHLRTDWYKYLLEILVLTIGIYCAFELENWNSRRQANNELYLSLQRLVNRVRLDEFSYSQKRDLYQFHIALTDSLLNPELRMSKYRIPAALQLLDYNAQEVRVKTKEEFNEILNQMEWDVQNPEHNELVMSLKEYGTSPSHPFEERVNKSAFSQHLIESGIPIGPYFSGTAYEVFASFPNFYNEEEIARAQKLLEDPQLRAELKSFNLWKVFFVADNQFSKAYYDQFYSIIQSVMPDVQIQFTTISLIGTGVGKDWITDFPLQKRSENDAIWEGEFDLKDGDVKFRADNQWVFDWGYGFTGKNTLAFKGNNIPVKKGRYQIKIDVYKGEVQFNPIN